MSAFFSLVCAVNEPVCNLKYPLVNETQDGINNMADDTYIHYTLFRSFRFVFMFSGSIHTRTTAYLMIIFIFLFSICSCLLFGFVRVERFRWREKSICELLSMIRIIESICCPKLMLWIDKFNMRQAVCRSHLHLHLTTEKLWMRTTDRTWRCRAGERARERKRPMAAKRTERKSCVCVASTSLCSSYALWIHKAMLMWIVSASYVLRAQEKWSALHPRCVMRMLDEMQQTNT